MPESGAASFRAETPNGSHRVAMTAPAHGQFGHDEGYADGEAEYQVSQDKRAAAVLSRQIRKPPQIAEPDGGTECGEQKAEPR
jgi:hypothetical protein